LGIDDQAEQDTALRALAARIAPLVGPKEIDAFFDRCREQYLRELPETNDAPRGLDPRGANFSPDTWSLLCRVVPDPAGAPTS